MNEDLDRIIPEIVVVGLRKWPSVCVSAVNVLVFTHLSLFWIQLKVALSAAHAVTYMLYPHVVYLHEAGLARGRPVVALPPIAQITAPPLAGSCWFHNTALLSVCSSPLQAVTIRTNCPRA